MKKTTQTLKEKYLIPEVEITNFIAEQGFGASLGTPTSNDWNVNGDDWWND